jgi:hypothetical protein
MVTLLLASLLAAVPLPLPTASAAPVLKTIVTVKSSSAFCGAFAAHVNSAIASAVDNDQTLATTITSLRSSDLGVDMVRRQNEINRLFQLGDDIYKQYRSGLNEVKQLRDLAAKTPDPNEKAAIKESADALGGALYRQHLVQRDLDGFAAYLQTGDIRDGMDPDYPDQPHNVGGSFPASQVPMTVWTPDGWSTTGVGVGKESWSDDVAMANAAADDFLRRVPAILTDEMNAGSRIETAGDHC